MGAPLTRGSLSSRGPKAQPPCRTKSTRRLPQARPRQLTLPLISTRCMRHGSPDDKSSSIRRDETRPSPPEPQLLPDYTPAEPPLFIRATGSRAGPSHHHCLPTAAQHNIASRRCSTLWQSRCQPLKPRAVCTHVPAGRTVAAAVSEFSHARCGSSTVTTVDSLAPHRQRS